jgi:hypothetical protein
MVNLPNDYVIASFDYGLKPPLRMIAMTYMKWGERGSNPHGVSTDGF